MTRDPAVLAAAALLLGMLSAPALATAAERTRLDPVAVGSLRLDAG